MTQCSTSSVPVDNAIGCLVFVTFAAIAMSCQTGTPVGQGDPHEASAQEGLLSTDELRKDNFTLRQHLNFSFEDRSGSIDAVVQKNCDSIVVVGLGPLSTRIFSIRQTGQDIVYEPKQLEFWAFSPHRILLDIQRSYLYPLINPPPADGVYHTDVAGFRVSEHWKTGRLRQRALSNSSPEQSERITIRYLGGLAHNEAPPPIELSDELRGYKLEVETVSMSPGECPD